MLKKLLEKFHDLYFGQKLILILLLFALIPLLCLQQIMMHFYEKQIITDASQSTLSVVRANNNVLSTLLDGVENTSNRMLNNEFYYDIFTHAYHSLSSCLHQFSLFVSSFFLHSYSPLCNLSYSFISYSTLIYKRKSNIYPKLN